MSNSENGPGLLSIGIYVVAVVFLIKLFAIQITNPNYKLQARNNVVKKMTVYPSRGLILDRKGRVIVSNDAVYDINIQYNQLKKFPLDTLLFCKLLEDILTKVQLTY